MRNLEGKQDVRLWQINGQWGLLLADYRSTRYVLTKADPGLQ